MRHCDIKAPTPKRYYWYLPRRCAVLWHGTYSTGVCNNIVPQRPIVVRRLTTSTLPLGKQENCILNGKLSHPSLIDGYHGRSRMRHQSPGYHVESFPRTSFCPVAGPPPYTAVRMLLQISFNRHACGEVTIFYLFVSNASYDKQRMCTMRMLRIQSGWKYPRQIHTPTSVNREHWMRV